MWWRAAPRRRGLPRRSKTSTGAASTVAQAITRTAAAPRRPRPGCRRLPRLQTRNGWPPDSESSPGSTVTTPAATLSGPAARRARRFRCGGAPQLTRRPWPSAGRQHPRPGSTRHSGRPAHAVSWTGSPRGVPTLPAASAAALGAGPGGQMSEWTGAPRRTRGPGRRLGGGGGVYELLDRSWTPFISHDIWARVMVVQASDAPA